MKPNQRGARWEKIAERYLRGKGMKTLCRNFHCRYGEIDLVMDTGQMIVFVEVRYRARTFWGTGSDSVDRRKQLKIVRTAGIFLSRKPAMGQFPCRFDIISIRGNEEKPVVSWIKDAFQAN